MTANKIAPYIVTSNLLARIRRADVDIGFCAAMMRIMGDCSELETMMRQAFEIRIACQNELARRHDQHC